MIILALDPSVTQCGVAVIDHGRGRPDVVTCSSFTSAGNSADEKCEAFGTTLRNIIDEVGPDFLVYESAMRFIAGYKKAAKPDLAGGSGGFWTPNSDQMLLPEIQGHIRQAAIQYSIPHEGVPVRTWRAALFGSGAGAWPKDKAKQAARDYCKAVHIDFSNHNEAEAACIGIWATRCSQPLRLMILGVEG